MEKATRKNLAKVSEEAAQIPFHGYIEGEESNLEPIIRFFPQWTLKEADGLWCAAFGPSRPRFAAVKVLVTCASD